MLKRIEEAYRTLIFLIHEILTKPARSKEQENRQSRRDEDKHSGRCIQDDG